MRRADANTDIYLKVFGKEIDLVDDVINLDDLKKRKVFKTCL